MEGAALSGTKRIAFLVVAGMAWLPAAVVAASLDDARVWLALGLSALGGGCAAIAGLARPEPAPVVVPVPARDAPAAPVPPSPAPAAEPALPPEVAAWVAAAREAMRPRVASGTAASQGEMASGAGPGASEMGAGASVDARLGRLAARQRAHTSALRHSIRRAIERQERAEPA